MRAVPPPSQGRDYVAALFAQVRMGVVLTFGEHVDTPLCGGRGGLLRPHPRSTSRPCHPERNEVESKFARRVIDERANRKAKPLRDLSKSVALQWRKVTFLQEKVRRVHTAPALCLRGRDPSAPLCCSARDDTKGQRACKSPLCSHKLYCATRDTEGVVPYDHVQPSPQRQRKKARKKSTPFFRR